MRFPGLLGLAAGLVLAACSGRDQPAGEVAEKRRSSAAVAAGEAEQSRAAAGVAAGAGGKRILFGDLHVHSTYSIDAYLYALPVFGGEGARPPADACDFARHCARLDFFSINDHAEGLTPEQWRRTIESIRACNDVAGDPREPDLVAFMGFEWTQVGPTPEEHFGHKNVIFQGLLDAELPARPISALSERDTEGAPPLWGLRALQTLGPLGLQEYADFLWWIERLARLETCERGVPVRELPAACRENAATPEELFAKLDEWGLPALVIPHGLAWGIHAPPGADLGNQLTPERHHPERQRLLEVFSGHGNGEEFRATPAQRSDVCPEPTRDYLPCCWRAGEIMRGRCGDLPEEECEARVQSARRLALEAGTAPHLVFPDTSVEDWLDCDQCRDCFKPALTLRPGMTAQYGAALSRPDPRGDAPRRFRWGFIASSDIHTARAGTGYKQLGRKGMTDSRGFSSPLVRGLLRRFALEETGDPREPQPVHREARSFASLFDVERTASFLYPGGLVAVHATGRDRGAIWDALQHREVYGTSGPRILLWFDLLNAPGGPAPMGSEVELTVAPRFEVRAVGSRVEQPGCPEESGVALPPERLASLCMGECHHPGDARHKIAAIEIVRIRPQRTPDEPIDALIEDPWRRIPCEPDPAGCVVRFEDPDFSQGGHDTVYYARALQEPTPAINGANLRTELDAKGNAVRTRPCYGDFRLPPDEQCLAPVQERAWSSPIYVDRPRR